MRETGILELSLSNLNLLDACQINLFKEKVKMEPTVVLFRLGTDTAPRQEYGETIFVSISLKELFHG